MGISKVEIFFINPKEIDLSMTKTMSRNINENKLYFYY
jgi:hypothetical protein